jgi:hypothetical protein
MKTRCAPITGLVDTCELPVVWCDRVTKIGCVDYVASLQHMVHGFITTIVWWRRRGIDAMSCMSIGQSRCNNVLATKSTSLSAIVYKTGPASELVR